MVPLRGDASTESVAALLELIAVQRPDLLELQLQTIATSVMGGKLFELAHAFDVPPEGIQATVIEACQDLDQLEKQRAGWRDPRKVLESPNIAALFYLCRARIGRISAARRRLRLGGILRKLKLARDLAGTQAWIEEFLGSSG